MTAHSNRVAVTTFRAKKADLRGYELFARYLVLWLNQRKDRTLRPHQRRVERAISALKELNASRLSSEKIEQLKRELRSLATHIQTVKWGALHDRERGWYLTEVTGDLTGFYLLYVAELSGYRLDWVQQCKKCRKWFVGYTRRGRFCSGKCKRSYEAAQRKTPEGREARKLYMRNIRAAKKYREQIRRTNDEKTKETPTGNFLR